MISHLSHLAIAVPDLDAAVKRMRDVYGLAAGEYHVNEQQGVRMAYVELGAAGARIELMEPLRADSRSEEHTSELQSLMRISYAVFCLKKKQTQTSRTDS